MDEKSAQGEASALPMPLPPLSPTQPPSLSSFPSASTLPSAPSRPLSLSPASLVSFNSQADGFLGCSHYRRSCQIRAPCCDASTFFPCRFCHDEAVSGHSIDRHSIHEMVCMLCAQRGEARAQPVGPECVDCHASMAAWFCGVCRFFDDEPNRSIFHCAKCGICRRGTREEFFHCDTCNCCYAQSMREAHKCIENVLSSDCPICLENLFTSTLPVNFLRCGHALHVSCLESLLRIPDISGPYRCPSCKKSIMEDEGRDRAIDEYLEMYPMPPEFSAWRAVILCNDCVVESEVPHHFAFHRCPRRRCQSYNTDVVRVLKIERGSEEDLRRQREQPPAAQGAGEGAAQVGAVVDGEGKAGDESDDGEDGQRDEGDEGGAGEEEFSDEASDDDFELLDEEAVQESELEDEGPPPPEQP